MKITVTLASGQLDLSIVK